MRFWERVCGTLNFIFSPRFVVAIFKLPGFLCRNFWPEVLLCAVTFWFAPMAGLSLALVFKLTFMLLGQNASFTMVSRSRQSNNFLYHGIASIGSNGFWVFVVAEIVAHYNSLPIKLWYITCTVIGSVHAHYLAIKKVEKLKAFKKDVGVTMAQFNQLQDEVIALGRVVETHAKNVVAKGEPDTKIELGRIPYADQRSPFERGRYGLTGQQA